MQNQRQPVVFFPMRKDLISIKLSARLLNLLIFAARDYRESIEKSIDRLQSIYDSESRTIMADQRGFNASPDTVALIVQGMEMQIECYKEEVAILEDFYLITGPIYLHEDPCAEVVHD